MSYAFPEVRFIRSTSSPGHGASPRVSLHMGLLSAQSPLPSLLSEICRAARDRCALRLLGFFDHHLLKRRASSLYPERDRTLFADWSETQAQLLQLIGLTAPSTLHWLFQRVSRARVEVRRSTERKPLNAEGVVLGNAAGRGLRIRWRDDRAGRRARGHALQRRRADAHRGLLGRGSLAAPQPSGVLSAR